MHFIFNIVLKNWGLGIGDGGLGIGDWGLGPIGIILNEFNYNIILINIYIINIYLK